MIKWAKILNRHFFEEDIQVSRSARQGACITNNLGCGEATLRCVHTRSGCCERGASAGGQEGPEPRALLVGLSVGRLLRKQRRFLTRLKVGSPCT